MEDRNLMLTGCEFNSEPNGHGHDAVMDNVQSANVIVLFSQHEKDRICELYELWEVVPPATSCYTHR